MTLLAHALLAQQPCDLPTVAWYPKVLPTFVDALALVRRRLWPSLTFQMSAQHADMIQVPRVLFERLTDTLCYAA